MNPDDNQPLPANYLDQIASKPPSKIGFLKDKKMLIIVILGFLAILTFIVIIIAGSVSGGSTNSTVQLAARLNSVKATVDTSNGKLKSSALRAANSELKIYLTNTIRDFKPLLATRGIDITKLDAKYTKLESNTALLARLEDARLNAVYDRTYAREMSTVLKKTMILMQDAYSQVRDTKTQSFLNDAYTNLKPIQEEFANFND